MFSLRYLAFGFFSGIRSFIASMGQAWMQAIQPIQPAEFQTPFCPSK